MEPVHASPTKQFFVSMLTKDIELRDAILDLLDNCVDGILRSHKNMAPADSERPYAGMWAEIRFDRDKFTIADNCGGIPRDLAINYAFRMGRRPDDKSSEGLPSVGMYGIGLKRALFKMGRKATVTTRTATDSYTVSIAPEWLDSDEQWDLTLEDHPPKFEQRGTVITVGELDPAVSRAFENVGNFVTDFEREVSTHYAMIIKKGLRVSIGHNGVLKNIDPKPLTILMDERSINSGAQAIAPYVYLGQRGDISFTVVVGIFDQVPLDDADSTDSDESPSQRRTREDAGWTVICNDRVVVYKDKTRLTGWGEVPVPSFHPQFITISGTVEFRTNRPQLLPVTTTKRGVNGNSELYLEVRNFMREGTKLFTDFTNKWKESKDEERKIIASAKQVDVRELVKTLPATALVSSRQNPGDKKFMPPLPLPKTIKTDAWVRFRRPIKEIEAVSMFLFDNKDQTATVVGEKCFERVLEEGKK